jgi:hypothetical protein
MEAAGAILLYLPPYSPDFNPIEMLFAKLKALLRSAAERTIASLWDAIGPPVDDFSADECSRYLAPFRIRLGIISIKSASGWTGQFDSGSENSRFRRLGDEAAADAISSLLELRAAHRRYGEQFRPDQTAPHRGRVFKPRPLL